MLTHSRNILIGSLAVIIAALLWSLDGTFLRPKLFTLPSVLVVFIEHTLGFIVLLPFLIIYKAQLKLINKKTWLTIFWVALFGGALGTTFITKAFFLTGFQDISIVILLQKFQPIFAIILAVIFLRERFSKKFYFYASLAIIGGYFVTFKDPFTIAGLAKAPAMAALFSLLAAFSWGSSTAFGKYSVKNINYGLLTALRFGLTVLIMVIPAIRYFGQPPSVTGTQWGVFATIVFTSGAAAMFLYYYGLKKIPASVATLCELAWPVSAIFLDYFLNKNVLSLMQILGTLILFGAVHKATTLNKSYKIIGAVIPGMKKGAELGLRTANLEPILAAKMSKGLYTCKILLDNVGYQGLLYYGYNSLSQKDCLEVHLLNFEGDIVGKKITVVADRYIRLPKKFKTAAELAGQLNKDLENISIPSLFRGGQGGVSRHNAQ